MDEGCPLRGITDTRLVSQRRIDIRLDCDGLEAGGVLLIGVKTRDGSSAVEDLRRLRRQHPHLVVFVHLDRTPGCMAHATQLARAGADELFVVENERDEADLGRALVARLRAPPPQRPLKSLAERNIPLWPMRVASHLLRNGYHAISVSRVAGFFGRSVRTLRNDAYRAHLPTPTDVARIGRWLHLLELSRRGINDSSEHARRLGFATATELRQWKWRLRMSADREPRIRELLEEFGVLNNLTNIGAT